MRAHHVAYGLDLQASFSLAGMPARSGAGLPALALELLAPAALAETWSGPQGSPVWTGRLGDGCSLTIERGTRGDVLFTYGDRARFCLDVSQERVYCAPQQPGLHWQQVLLGRVLPNVALMRGYEALHASAVESPEGVLAIAGPSGTGKTTLALELMGRGWPLFTDDVLVVDEGVRGHPGSPHMNVAEPPPGAVEPELLGVTLGRLAGERWIAAHTTAERPRPVRMVCLLERGAEHQLASRIVAPNPLPLAPYMLGLPDEDARARRRFERYADLMGTTSLMRLTCSPTDRPADAADLIEQALVESPALVAGGAG